MPLGRIFKLRTAIISAVLTILPNVTKANASVFEGIDSTYQFQEKLIRERCNASDYSPELCDNYRLPLLCTQTFLESLKYSNGEIPEVSIFHAPQSQFQIGVYTEWSKERVKEEIGKVRAWVNQYPFELATMYKCTDMDKLLSAGKMVIVQDCYFHGMEHEVTLMAFIQEDDKLHELTIRYVFHLAFVKDHSDKLKFGKSLKHFVESVMHKRKKLVSKDGLLLESFNKEIGWTLVEIDFSLPHILEYEPGENTADFIFEYNNVALPE